MNRLHSIPDTTFPQQSLVLPLKIYGKSMFTGHLLKPVHHENNPIGKFQPDWITGFLISFFILIAWSQVFFGKRLKQVLMAPLSKRFLNQLIRDGNLFKERISVALGIVYVLSFSLLIFQINEILLKWAIAGYKGFFLFLIITGLFTGFWAIKIFTVRFIGFVFRTKNTTREYLLNMLIFCLVTGLIILPFLVIIVYMKSVFMLYCTVGIISLLFIFRFVRGFFIGIRLTKFSYLFLIVYLCALEILPLLVLVKLLLNYMHPSAL